MIAVLALACWGLLAQEPPPDLGTRKAGVDWPCFLGPNHDGTSSEKGLPASWPAQGPRIVWQKELGEGQAPPTVQRGRLFHFDLQGAKFRLSCLKSETGDELWRFEYPTNYVDGYGADNGPRCCPVVDGDRVYLFGPEGMLHCIRVADGKEIWKKDTTKEFGVVQNFFGVGSTPVIEGDLLIVQIGGSPAGSPGVGSGNVQGNGSGIVAFDKRSGALKYKVTDELASYSSPTLATIGGRRWGFVYTRNGLVGFEPSTGKVDFNHPWRAQSTTTVNICNPVVGGDLIYVSEAYGVGASVVRVKPGGCDVVWSDGRKRERSFMSYWNTPIHVDGYLYGAHGISGEDLRCVEMATGKLAWSDADLHQCSLLRVDGRFISLGEDGQLRLLKLTPQRGEVVSQVRLKSAAGVGLLQSPARAAPVLSHGLLYVRGIDRLVCVEVIPAAVPDDHPLTPEYRAKMNEKLDETIELATGLIASDPKAVESYSLRGDALFKRAQFAKAVVDYDKMVEIDKALDTGHWRRGIAWFYAGDYAKAAGQFEAYHSFDNVDRENGIWRYFSQAKAFGIPKGREGLLKYAKDDREPFPGLYRLFEGKTPGEKILEQIKAAQIGDSDRDGRLFYANLYIGLNAAIENRPDEARKHLREAVASKWAPEGGYGPSYMWHVGRVHYDLLQPLTK